MPVRISGDLASLLESHPTLPSQSAGGMSALTAPACLDEGYDDYGKASPKATGSKPPKEYQDS